MGYIVLNSVTFTPTPTTTQVVDVYYRYTSDPDDPMYYTLASSGEVINTDGTLQTPLTIYPLDDNTNYTVMVVQTCDNSEFKKDFYTGVIPFNRIQVASGDPVTPIYAPGEITDVTVSGQSMIDTVVLGEDYPLVNAGVDTGWNVSQYAATTSTVDIDVYITAYEAAPSLELRVFEYDEDAGMPVLNRIEPVPFNGSGVVSLENVAVNPISEDTISVRLYLMPQSTTTTTSTTSTTTSTTTTSTTTTTTLVPGGSFIVTVINMTDDAEIETVIDDTSGYIMPGSFPLGPDGTEEDNLWPLEDWATPVYVSIVGLSSTPFGYTVSVYYNNSFVQSVDTPGTVNDSNPYSFPITFLPGSPANGDTIEIRLTYTLT